MISPAVRAVGVVLCLTLYALSDAQPSPLFGVLGVNLLVWLLCSATGGWKVWWLLYELPGAAPRLHVSIAMAYLGFSVCLVLCDLCLLWCLVCRRPPDYRKLSEADVSEGVPTPAPGPSVAVHPNDSGLVYTHDRVNFFFRITYSWATSLLREAYSHPVDMPRLGKLPLYDSAVQNFKTLHALWRRQVASKEV